MDEITIKTKWTSEMAEDLMSYYEIDAEAELSKLLSEEIWKVEIEEEQKNIRERRTKKYSRI